MRIKLVEEWKHYLNEDIVKQFTKAIDDGDSEQIISRSRDMLIDIKQFFDPEEQREQLRQIDKLIKKFDSIEPNQSEESYDAIDTALDLTYDFLDNNRIFIDKLEFH